MAAVAHDVVRSRDAQLNFLVSVGWLPRPASTHPADARAAAAEATDRVRREPALVEARCHEELCDFDGLCRAELAGRDKEFVLDLRSPRLWAEMSETMLLDPLRQCVCRWGRISYLACFSVIWFAVLIRVIYMTI
jgi:hypothetical protein